VLILEKEYLIALDSGTTACKVIIVDKNGNVVAEATQLHEPFFSRQPGWAEQNPRDWWIKFCKATRDALKKAEIPLGKLAALGITTQRGTLIPLDKDGNELRPAICWIDIRPWPRYKWIKENEPEILRKTYKIVGVQSWFVYKLTGEWKDSKASTFLGLSRETWDWDKRLVDLGELPREMLPEFHLPGEVLGYVTVKAAKETGLPEGLPVVAGCGDKQSGTLGTGCLEPEQLMISYGTALSLGATTYEPPSPPLLARLSGIPCAYNAEIGLSGGFWMCEWFKEQFCLNDLKELDEKAAAIPAGSHGLVVQPYWWGGNWCSTLGPVARGAVLGWTGIHTCVHFFRAILEGIVYEARHCKELTEKYLRTSFRDIRVAGGGAKSDLVMQITADILGQRVGRTQTTSVEALGAAMLAAKGSELYKTIEEAVTNMSRVVQTFEPIPMNVKLYDKIYRRVYLKIYPSVEKLYKEIMEITGFGGGWTTNIWEIFK